MIFIVPKTAFKRKSQSTMDSSCSFNEVTNINQDVHRQSNKRSHSNEISSPDSLNSKREKKNSFINEKENVVNQPLIIKEKEKSIDLVKVIPKPEESLDSKRFRLENERWKHQKKIDEAKLNFDREFKKDQLRLQKEQIQIEKEFKKRELDLQHKVVKANLIPSLLSHGLSIEEALQVIDSILE